jgi:tRNA G10  N-methylase Trm11
VAKTVGIEIAHDGLVNRTDIRRDFSTRNLTSPVALIEGDCTRAETRDMARQALDSSGIIPPSFDAIVADPPYGIRESIGLPSGAVSDGLGEPGLACSPALSLVEMIRIDRDRGTPLLRVGGRLVVFVPIHSGDGESLQKVLPSSEAIQAAGLRFEGMQEQPLNDKLSRWLVSFVCVLS